MSLIARLLSVALLPVEAALSAWVERRSRRRVVLKLRLQGTLFEAGGSRRSSRPTLLGWLRLLRDAGADPSVRGVTLRLGKLDVGWAQADELRAAIAALRATGRTVHAYLERPGQTEYYLATACDRVTLPPESVLDVLGLRAEVTFFKGALDKLGVEATFVAAGDYKSLGEPFTRETMSEPFRESLDGVLGAIHGGLRDGIAEGRGLEPEAVQALIDGGPWFAGEAVEQGLIDDAAYPDRWIRAVRKAHEADDAAGPVEFKPGSNWLRPRRWLRAVRSHTRRRPVVAVLVAQGEIIDSDEGRERVGKLAHRPLRATLRALADDDRVAAVVLRVDSPGGSAVASDLIWRELRRLRKKKPVVASMANTAASGGYYLAMAADRVFAAPGTITGSIGVVAGKFDVSGLLDRIGIRNEVLSYGANTGMFSATEGLDERTEARLREQIEQFYGSFVGKAARCRGLDYDALEEHARGRIWTGTQAVERGLVDAVGGVQDAIADATDRAGLDRAEVWVVEPPLPPPWERLGRALPGGMASRLPRSLRELVPALRAQLDLPDDGAVLARLPYELRIR